MKFSIKGAGVLTDKFKFSPVSNYCTYVHTSLSSNNDFLIKEWVQDCIKKFPMGFSLITSARCLDMVDQAIIGHLEELGVSKINLLLLNPDSNFIDYQSELVKVLDSGLVGDYGIENPQDLEKLKAINAFFNSIGIKISYVSLPICPLNFNKEIIDWCKENNVSLICTNPFGSDISREAMIDSFTTAFLLKFAAYWCDLVFVPIESGKFDVTYLESLIDMEVPESEISLFDVKKTISMLYKPFPKAIFPGLKFNMKYIGGQEETGDTVLPLDTSSDLLILGNSPELVFRLGKPILPKLEALKSLEIGDQLDRDLEKQATDYFLMSHRPSDGGEEEWYSVFRHKVLELFKSKHSGWKLEYSRFDTNRVLFLRATKETIIDGGWFKKDVVKTETKDYLLYFQSGTFLFKRIS